MGGKIGISAKIGSINGNIDPNNTVTIGVTRIRVGDCRRYSRDFGPFFAPIIAPNGGEGRRGKPLVHRVNQRGREPKRLTVVCLLRRLRLRHFRAPVATPRCRG